jgi:hypothetical protein
VSSLSSSSILFLQKKVSFCIDSRESVHELENGNIFH